MARPDSCRAVNGGPRGINASVRAVEPRQRHPLGASGGPSGGLSGGFSGATKRRVFGQLLGLGPDCARVPPALLDASLTRCACSLHNHQRAPPQSRVASDWRIMEAVKSTAQGARKALALPPQLVSMYGDFIAQNGSAVSQIESGLRSLTYFIPGSLSRSRLLLTLEADMN